MKLFASFTTGKAKDSGRPATIPPELRELVGGIEEEVRKASEKQLNKLDFSNIESKSVQYDDKILINLKAYDNRKGVVVKPARFLKSGEILKAVKRFSIDKVEITNKDVLRLTFKKDVLI